MSRAKIALNLVRVDTSINTVNKAVTTIPLDKVNNHFITNYDFYQRNGVCLTSSHTHNTETTACTSREVVITSDKDQSQQHSEGEN